MANINLTSGEWKQIAIKRNYRKNGYNASDNWTTFTTVWGMVQLGTGREYYAAKQRVAELDGLTQLQQYAMGLSEAMRLYIDNIAYEIIAIRGVREQGFQEIQFKKVKA